MLSCARQTIYIQSKHIMKAPFVSYRHFAARIWGRAKIIWWRWTRVLARVLKSRYSTLTTYYQTQECVLQHVFFKFYVIKQLLQIIVLILCIFVCSFNKTLKQAIGGTMLCYVSTKDMATFRFRNKYSILFVEYELILWWGRNKTVSQLP